jgi:hypothetical protein
VNIEISVPSAKCGKNLEASNNFSTNDTVQELALDVDVSVSVSKVYGLNELVKKVNDDRTVRASSSSVDVETRWRAGELPGLKEGFVVHASVSIGVHLQSAKAECSRGNPRSLNFLPRSEIGAEDEQICLRDNGYHCDEKRRSNFLKHE